MSVLVVTGTGTEVGKTIVTAALAAVALDQGRTVAVIKPAQTGVAGPGASDMDVVARLVGDGVSCHQRGRYPEPLAPNTAARRAGMAAVHPADISQEVNQLSRDHDLVLVEGSGGLLARFDDAGATLMDIAELLDSPVLVVAHAGLGTLNASALTTEALRHRLLRCAGLVIGSWPTDPDLAMRCNLTDLPDVTGSSLLGALPLGAGNLPPGPFLAAARASLAPELGGTWDAAGFAVRYAPPPCRIPYG
ncbi:MAG: dethiobiotin synthase [Pseudonocardiaceae bacterium]